MSDRFSIALRLSRCRARIGVACPESPKGVVIMAAVQARSAKIQGVPHLRDSSPPDTPFSTARLVGRREVPRWRVGLVFPGLAPGLPRRTRFPRWQLCRLIPALVLLLAGSATVAANGVTTLVEVTALDGTQHTGQLGPWTPEQLSLVNPETGAEQTFAPSRMAVMEFPGNPERLAAGAWVVLTNGDRIAVSSPRIAEETFQAAWQRAPLRPEIRIPLECVAGILQEVSPARSRLNEQLAELTRAETGHDTLAFLTGDDLQGQLNGLDGGLVDFEAAIGQSRLDLRRLRTIALDPSLATIPDKPAHYWIVQLTDGSRVTAADVVPRDDGTVRIQPVAGDPFFAVFHELVRLTRFSDQLVPLSARTPRSVDYQPFLGGKAALQTDRSLRRTPLMIRQREFPTGIGMTSRMSVTYQILPGDQSFRASVGIDDSAREQGAARFELLLDDVAVWSSNDVDGHAEPLPTPLIELAGHQSLTLRVDFGRNGDVGDIANWCDAVVLRQQD